MPRTSQTEVFISTDVSRLEDFPQAVVAYGRDLAAGDVLSFHHHQRAQLVYASSGVMTVTTLTAAYIVPPQNAVWMLAGVRHRIDARSDVLMRTVYVDTEKIAGLPEEVCVLQVSTLLRELIIAAVEAGSEYDPDSPQARIMEVILDQIIAQPVAALALPMPLDGRLVRIAEALVCNPADNRNLGEWAREVGASKRTLTRLFAIQTGMSFRAWRQQCRLHCALELLAAGRSVTVVSGEVGYENASAFIAMFQRCLGTSPSRFLNQS
ncbi:AraC family transcriptional regulator [Granulosicoccus antarcticus]|uniref:HTH-type transcriptional regulator NimR n=1 Tax=Granulosicoccus antarcticus IMCC3135 TaxID=1192854 RepID=A0A2Z2NQR8_9GAMM|nr:helix-turn-helix transcriptional regulator [Granulosicoccus antarcticus]ASJ73826.1 HTH-type transcriptional regulator NimR [Granulosicoccus antarcticus IMCC3135]